MDNRVVIRHTRDVPAGPNQLAQFAGQVFTVTDAATAKRLYPHSTVLKYANGRKFVATQDESLIAEREAEEAAKAKAEEKAKAKADAAKATATKPKDA